MRWHPSTADRATCPKTRPRVPSRCESSRAARSSAGVPSSSTCVAVRPVTSGTGTRARCAPPARRAPRTRRISHSTSRSTIGATRSQRRTFASAPVRASAAADRTWTSSASRITTARSARVARTATPSIAWIIRAWCVTKPRGANRNYSSACSSWASLCWAASPISCTTSCMRRTSSLP